MNIVENISVLGDSILRGVIFDEISGKYKFLKASAVNLFAQSNQINALNYSKFGCTTKEAKKSLNSMLARDILSKAVLLELGGNDCDYDWDAVAAKPNEAHIPKVSFTEFKESLNEIIETVLSAGKRPVLMNLPPIDSDKYFNKISKHCKERAANILSFLGDKSMIYRQQELYSSALDSAARKHNLYIVQVREAFLSLRRLTDYLCEDGIHPNARGQMLIKQVFDNAYRDYITSL